MATKAQADRAFAMLEAAAVAGTRCPMSDSIPGGSATVSTLAHGGRIFVEVFVHNFRVVTIMEGEHAGKQTAPPPTQITWDGKRKAPRPYLTVGKDGTRRNGRLIDTGYKDRTMPSRPREII